MLYQNSKTGKHFACLCSGNFDVKVLSIIGRSGVAKVNGILQQHNAQGTMRLAISKKLLWTAAETSYFSKQSSDCLSVQIIESTLHCQQVILLKCVMEIKPSKWISTESLSIMKAIRITLRGLGYWLRNFNASIVQLRDRALRLPFVSRSTESS